jgi:uncharacterized protein
MRRGSAVTVYLSDEATAALDAEVERRANKDRENGLKGYSVTNRSKLISLIVSEYLATHAEEDLSVDVIRKAVAPVLEEYAIAKASLFGSYARGEQTSDSEVDIIVMRGALRGLKFMKLKEDLEAAVGKPVNLKAFEDSLAFTMEISKECVNLILPKTDAE